MYKALYRRWRPSRFDEIIGQEHVSLTLKNEVLTGNVSHAYIFVGSRGTGKTTTAKILAKVLNCVNVQDGEPCCTCHVCAGIDAGNILDVLEIDAASSTGVDNIRSLREDAKFAPTVGKCRVYIIDEAHMLSIGAFNALLKIMEDPPKGVVFILATTQINKIPATILSRCQRFDFSRLTPQGLKEHIIKIASSEKISINEEGALLIAVLAEGGVRDALSLLDVCSSVAGDALIDEALVEKTAALPFGSVCLDLVELITQKKTEESLKVIGDCYLKAVDMASMCEMLLKSYRDILLLKLCRNELGLFEIPQRDLRKIQEIEKIIETEQILRNIDILKNCHMNISKSANPKMDLELCVINLSLAEKKAVGSGTVTKVQQGEVSLQKWPNILKRLSGINAALSDALVGSKAYLRDDVILIDAKCDSFLDLIRRDEQAKLSLKEAIFKELGRKHRIGPYRET
ncbi:MAG: DNA polymerase III subunit gamma/tau [Oscillospiraceae bacterium]|nr:DNA polymerase III subunit gamma/tau [Oscillospiraceae bacterium]